jgi:hypothetical protein
MFEVKPETTAVMDRLVASYGQALPHCPNCHARMVMACREVEFSEPVIFTFQCRVCRNVLQRAKARL